MKRLEKLSLGDGTGANLRLSTKKTDRRFLIQTEKRRRLLQADEKGNGMNSKQRRCAHATVAPGEQRAGKDEIVLDLVLASSGK